MKGAAGGKRFNSISRRLREIETVIAARHGLLPATDDADLYLLPIAQHLRARAEQTARIVYGPGSIRGPSNPDLTSAVIEMLRQWCARSGPEISDETCIRIARDACRNGRVPRADALGKRLRLSYAERQRLGITMIGAFDVDRKQRAALAAERKREADRHRAAAKRRRQGRISRATYEANSVNRLRPWRALDISRATWFRRRKSESDTAIEQSLVDAEGAVAVRH